MYDPKNGEKPLEGDVPVWGQGQWQGPGGGSVSQQANAWQDFYKLFGRNPTASELARLAPAYAGDPNRTNSSQGMGAVAQYYDSFANSPANIYANQQKEWTQNAPQHYDSVRQIIQSTLGRQATDDELSHYATLIASGQADPYQIQQFIQSTPEYQNAQDTQFRQGLDTQLQKSDTDFFNTQKGNIAQQFALMGRATSPALDVALTQLASQLNSQRGQYLAQLSASQYGGNKANAVADYNATKSGVTDRINQNTSGVYNNNIALNKRFQDITDYNTQQNAYSDVLNRYGPGRSPTTLDYLNTGLNAANTAAKIYAAA